ncbi:adenylate kinase 8 isoform X3 [Chrysemys picta bellii]|uniref:adenylate kinase 8 isoform X3 n=1 Tax=Chrysemys picta bellii TaxID=8478 RepID=UPI0032B2EB04
MKKIKKLGKYIVLRLCSPTAPNRHLPLPPRPDSRGCNAKDSCPRPWNMLEGLLIHKPDEPIEYMISHLKQDNDHVPRICILGPPASGKTTIATWLCKQLNTPCITQETLLEETLELTKEVKAFQERGQKIPNALWANLIQERLSNVDCIKQGWILEGFPENRDQAWMLQSAGITPRHVVVLYAPDMVLIERNLGKRIDPSTKEVYHTTFDWPSDPLVQQRLVEAEGISEQETAKHLLEYHRNFPRVFQIYQQILKSINADQPCADVFSQALTYVQTWCRSAAPFTPRILFCGPPGSGKSLQAALIAQKYSIVNIPDNIVLKLLADRLNRLDCMTDGWVLHGFPKDLDQAEQMERAGIIPNRIFFLNLPSESVMERLAQRMIDPVTGERYHAMYKPAPLPDVQARLMQNPKDTEENIRICLETYYRHAGDLEEFYGDAFYINADQDPYVVFEYIESCIVKPLPHKS